MDGLPDGEVKIVVAGPSNSGKTSLIRRYIIADDKPLESTTTQNVDFVTQMKRIGDQNIHVQIWNTAGFDEQRSRPYFRGANVVFIVCDVTNRATFDALPDWKKFVLSLMPTDSQIYLVGNKCDCDVERKISNEEGTDIALSLGFTAFVETSAKQNINVKDLFSKVTTLTGDTSHNPEPKGQTNGRVCILL